MKLLFTTSLLLVLGYKYLYTEILGPIIPLFRESRHTNLQFPTRQLNGSKVIILLIYHILKSLLRRIGIKLGSTLSITNSEGIPQNDKQEYEYENSDISLSMPFQITISDINQYIKCISPIPHTNKSISVENVILDSNHLQLILSSLTEPSMLCLLSKINCPIDPIGSVNVRNRFEILDPSLCRRVILDQIQNNTKSNNQQNGLITKAKLNNRVKKVKRGWEFIIVVELLLKDKPIYKQEFTMLQFHKHSSPPSLPTLKNQGKELVEEAIGNFRIDSIEPSNWAKSSKDYNPIHTSDLAARILGFKRKIAHGNHVVAKAIQEVSEYLIDRQEQEASTWMEVEFRRPVTVPSQLDIKLIKDEQGDTKRRLEILADDKVVTTITCG